MSLGAGIPDIGLNERDSTALAIVELGDIMDPPPFEGGTIQIDRHGPVGLAASDPLAGAIGRAREVLSEEQPGASSEGLEGRIHEVDLGLNILYRKLIELMPVCCGGGVPVLGGLSGRLGFLSGFGLCLCWHRGECRSGEMAI